MKTSKRPSQLAKNASGLHKHVGSLLTSMKSLKGFEIRQEYPVKKVNPEFKSGREKFDWVILGARIVVECHGEQHYKPVCFGGIDKEQAKKNLISVQARDEEKQAAAHDAGWTYVVVRYDEENITEEMLYDKIKTSLACDIVNRSLGFLTKIAETQKIEKKKGKTKWPSKKIPSRPFSKKMHRS